MKKIIILLCALSLAGCNKWLDVNSGTEVRAEDMFKNEEGFFDALTGLYIGMTQPQAYGKELSWGGVEFMAWEHQNTQNTGSYFDLQRGDYQANKSQQFGSLAWDKLYNVIAEANYLLWAVDEWGDHLSPGSRRTVRGEALAIRAYCHLDLMRLFCPAVSAAELDKKCVPYVTEFSRHIPQQRTYRQALEMLDADIEQAMSLLDERQVPEAERLQHGATHFNYGAVALLRARAALWAGDKAKAAQYAEELIATLGAENSRWGIDNAGTGIMLTEVLWGLNVWDLKALTKTSWDLYLGSSLNQDILLSPGEKFVADNLFMQSNTPLGTPESDLRYVHWFKPFDEKVNEVAVKGHLTVKVRNTGANANSLVPLLRMSEAWLIAAEAQVDTDKPRAVALVNELRAKRNIAPARFVPENITPELLRQAITLECRREFVQEGQLFFMYKRLGTLRIPGSALLVDMTPERYSLPWPQDNISFGIDK